MDFFITFVNKLESEDILYQFLATFTIQFKVSKHMRLTSTDIRCILYSLQVKLTNKGIYLVTLGKPFSLQKSLIYWTYNNIIRQ